MADSKFTAENQKQIEETFRTMLGYLGFGSETAFTVEEEDAEHAVIKITSEDAGRLIGRRGQIVDNLQLVLNRILYKGNEKMPIVSLSINGYGANSQGDGEERPRRSAPARGERPAREGRGGGSRFTKEELEQLARDKAKEVKRWGDPVKLPDLNAHDRRIVHLTLQDDPEITTESEGEGAIKKVVISLKQQA